MVDVFISYSREDLTAVSRLAEAVEAEGYEVWWDADLPPHLSYGDVITNKIGMAKAAIVVWSKSSAASEWVRAEADMARNQKKLVQTALADVMPPLPFNQIQYAEIGDWKGEPDHPGWRKVKASLAELCGPRDGVQLTGPAGAGQHRFTPPPAPPPPPQKTQLSRQAVFIGLGAFGAVALLTVAFALGGNLLSSDPDEDEAAGGDIAALISPTEAPTTAPSTAAPTAAASASASASAGDELDRHVMVNNMSTQTMRELYASPVTSDNWEEDLLGNGTLAAGSSINANIDNGTTECMYDLKAVMADEREYIQREINVCEARSWSIGDSGDSVG